MQEKFVVRTVWWAENALNSRTTIARSRPEAVLQAERIGNIHTDDRAVVRSFLEGDPSRPIGNCSSVTFCSGEDRWRGVATIFSLDED